MGLSSGSFLTHRTGACMIGAGIAAVVLLAGAGKAQALSTKLYVANTGTDNADCGPADKLPCRSISRAIAHASAGDQIIVGPGFYGDINQDDIVDPNGDSGEGAPVTVTMGTTSHPAMININKQLTIVSRDGAGATVIDAGSEDIGVVAAAEGVVFGKTGKGFTVRNAQYGGVYISVDNVTLQGNIAENAFYFGFAAGY
jgi:hypothetical protein